MSVFIITLLVYFFLGIGPMIYVADRIKGDPDFTTGVLIPSDEKLTPTWFILIVIWIFWIPLLVGAFFERFCE